MSHLFDEIKIRDLSIRNRIFVSPMCQYSSEDGKPTNWHMVHLGSRAVGGAGLVMVEATATSPEGRISPNDSGLWNFEQAAAFRPITEFMLEQGTVPAIQLAHAGRKASTRPPGQGRGPLQPEEAPWETLAPSPIAFAEKYPAPREMDLKDIKKIVNQFRKSTEYSLSAGFQVVEIHMAHGYLLHEFLSPLTNIRTDEFGGRFENRVRLPLHVAEEVRQIWPEKWPVFVRISCTDWTEGGWDLDQSIQFAKLLREREIDLIDCSSGGIMTGIKIPVAPGYQVPFSAQIRKEVEIKTAAVGLITQPHQAEQIIGSGEADVIMLARELLRNPYWPRTAAKSLAVEFPAPLQYERAY
jgi:2,4-dienoyl-CoA reductase-like NADH-dependent reductase (Old Yellow Enzyme family)